MVGTGLLRGEYGEEKEGEDFCGDLEQVQLFGDEDREMRRQAAVAVTVSVGVSVTVVVAVEVAASLDRHSYYILV